MIQVSEAYNKIPKENRIYHALVKVQLADSTLLTIDDDTIMAGGLTIETATSQTDSFEIGGMVIGKLTLRISNEEDQYTPYDFTNAVIKPQIGLELEDGTVEWLDKGTFTAERAATAGSVWTITAYDNMARLDQLYSKSSLKYPTTVRQIVNDACNVCGLILSSERFFGEDGTIQAPPAEEALTFRAVLSYVAQITGNYGYCDIRGRLAFGWYDVDTLRNYGQDGGRFDDYDINAYTTGDVLDGGTFLDYTSGAAYDEGTFLDWAQEHNLYDVASLDVDLWDVRITGVRVKTTGIFTLLTVDEDGGVEESEEEVSAEYLYGKEGYVLTIDENPLISRNLTSKQESGGKALQTKLKSVATNIAQSVGSRIIDMKFRPLSMSIQSDPCVEAGDLATVTDYRGLTYATVLTNVTYVLGGNASYSCGAVSAVEQNAERPSATDIKLEQAKQSTQAKIQNHKTEMQRLTGLVTKSLGIFKTEEQQEDGSAIFYMHDKPKLEDSSTLWRMSAGVFSVSTDGGKSWNAGIDAQGNAVVNLLSAIGINFDWAKGGQLTLGGKSNANGIFRLLANDDSEMIRMDYEGIKLANGASLMSANGVCGNLQFVSNGGIPARLGGWTYYGDPENMLILAVRIPDNYNVVSAKLTLLTSGARWFNQAGSGNIVGYARKIKLFKATTGGFGLSGPYSGNLHYGKIGEFEQIVGGGFSSAGFTGGTSVNTTKITASADLAKYLKAGLNIFAIQAETSATSAQNTGVKYIGTGMAIFDIIGYSKN